MQGERAFLLVFVRLSVEEGAVETGDFSFFATAFQRLHDARCHLACGGARVGEAENTLRQSPIQQ